LWFFLLRYREGGRGGTQIKFFGKSRAQFANTYGKERSITPALELVGEFIALKRKMEDLA
jgi:hypothetical protein